MQASWVSGKNSHSDNGPVPGFVGRVGVAQGSCWAVILAAGEGRRVAAMIAESEGNQLPKQYWDPGGGDAMVEWALARALALVPPERVLVVVAPHHRGYWLPLLTGRIPGENILVQPEDRGTAAGILYPLLRILSRDPAGRLFILPSDHHIEREDLMQEALRRALGIAERSPSSAVLLGMCEGSSLAGYGWMRPGPVEPSGACMIERFVEKPGAETRKALLAEGALVNSFVMASRGQALLAMLRQAVPELLVPFEAASREMDEVWDPSLDQERLEALYRLLPSRDFSHHVLTESIGRLKVLRVPQCGWSDLGDPARLAVYRKRLARPAPEFLWRKRQEIMASL